MHPLAQQVLDVEIDLRGTSGASFDEMHSLVKSHQTIQQARDDFLEGKLQWWEYLELVEMHHVNIDSYLNTVEDNLHDIGIIV